jgi:MSHA biogenesis protein MshE
MDMGLEPYVIGSALVGVVAQRLVRRLCDHCRRQYTPPADTLRLLHLSEADAASIPFYKAVGCDQCSHTGYRGRIGIYELLELDDALIAAIHSRDPMAFAQAVRQQAGYQPLKRSALELAGRGLTTIDQVLRATFGIGD